MTRKKIWRLALPIGLVALAATAAGTAQAATPSRHGGGGPSHAAPPPPATASFAEPVQYPAGIRDWAVAYADLNGDGKVDAATANGGNSMSVYLGRGDGTFSPKTDYATPSLPYFLAFDVVAADFNGDRKPDIAVSGGNPVGNIALFLNKGNGTFASPVGIPMGYGPNEIDAADLNRDGRQDLITTDNFAAQISVRLGNGDGTFKPEQRFDVGPGPQGIDIGDVNGDHVPDILTGNFGRLKDSLSVLIGKGNGTFQPARNYAAGNSVNDVAIGDFNHDGIQDVALPEFVNSQVDVLLGRRGGGFGPVKSYSIGTGVNEITLGDFNSDGKLDIATTVSPDGNRDPSAPPPPTGLKGAGVSLLLGDGDGSFAPNTILAIDGAMASVKAVDVNGDRRDDLIAANLNNQTLVVWLNTTAKR